MIAFVAIIIAVVLIWCAVEAWALRYDPRLDR